MSAVELTSIILTALVAGAIASVGSAILTVAALRVHIEYLRQACGDNKDGLKRAHERIDEILQNGCSSAHGNRR